jgi:hypothetical protein
MSLEQLILERLQSVIFFSNVLDSMKKQGQYDAGIDDTIYNLKKEIVELYAYCSAEEKGIVLPELEGCGFFHRDALAQAECALAARLEAEGAQLARDATTPKGQEAPLWSDPEVMADANGWIDRMAEYVLGAEEAESDPEVMAAAREAASANGWISRMAEYVPGAEESDSEVEAAAREAASAKP